MNIDNSVIYQVYQRSLSLSIDHHLLYLDEHKTAKEKQREEELIRQISQLVEAKNRLTNDLEQMRLR